MRHLDRTQVASPPCLALYQHGRDTWETLSPDHREEIRAHLHRLQDGLCAYCEGSLSGLGEHIEHFRKRAASPQLTFAWSNLLGSCSKPDSCGKFKDNGAGKYDIGDVIDPATDQPDDYLRFISDGSIAPRGDLDERRLRRATETVRVLGLDATHGRLRKMREVRLRQYLDADPGMLDALADWPEADRRAYVDGEIAATATGAFCTTLRHFLESLL